MDIATDGKWEGTLAQLLDIWEPSRTGERAVATVTNTVFFSIGAACLFVESAVKFSCGIHLMANGTSANAKSVKDILALHAKPGDFLSIEAVGPGAKEAAQELMALVASRFGINSHE